MRKGSGAVNYDSGYILRICVDLEISLFSKEKTKREMFNTTQNKRGNFRWVIRLVLE